MKLYDYFSWSRLYAMLDKEVKQIRRDKGTIAMLVMIPIMQLLLFGFAINLNPHHLRTVVVTSDKSTFSRSFLRAMENSVYFDVINNRVSSPQAKLMLADSSAQFSVQFEPQFERKLIRQEHPAILVTADASDPSTTGAAINVLSHLHDVVFDELLSHGLQRLLPGPEPFRLLIHSAYNSEHKTQYSIIPGLIGLILTMTLVMVTSQAITREYERGTIEGLMVMPISGLEVMLGKIIPYIVAGFIQLGIILLIAHWVFAVPIEGSIVLLLLTTLPFIAATLGVGLIISTYAKTQLQAMQMTVVYLLPSILLSGFVFPFYGMPTWAQYIGSVLPLTYYLRIVRGIMLKGNTLLIAWTHLWPLLILVLVILLICVRGYRQTLD